PITSSVITIKFEEGTTLSSLLTGIITGLIKIPEQFITYLLNAHRQENKTVIEDEEEWKSLFWSKISSIRIFYSESLKVNHVMLERGVKSTIKARLPSSIKPATTLIPVLSIIDDCAVGICVHDFQRDSGYNMSYTANIQSPQKSLYMRLR
ncbi:4570_t:CDS:2, partial [Acaulospora morrowiae]